MPDISRDPQSRAAASAQTLAIAASVAALLMFGALVHEGKGRHAPAAVSYVAPYSDEDNTRPARKAVLDTLREKFPNAKVDGVFLLPLTRDATAYFARADTSLGESRGVLPALVCQYTRRNGSTYWRAESLSRDQAAERLQQAVEAAGNRDAAKQ